VVAVPVGAWLLVNLDPSVMNRVIGVVVLCFAGALEAGWRYRGSGSLALQTGVGAASGFLGGAIGIPGPPVILFYLSGPAGARTARASIMGFFMFTTGMTLGTYYVPGLYTATVVSSAVVLVPAYVLGVWAGSRLFGSVSERAFRVVALLLLVTIGFTALVS